MEPPQLEQPSLVASESAQPLVATDSTTEPIPQSVPSDLSAEQLEEEHSSDPEIEGQPKDIILKHLPSHVDEDFLRKICARHGPVLGVKLIRDRVTNSSKGYAFVEYPSHDHALAAAGHLKGVKIGQKKIKVTLCDDSVRHEGALRRRERRQQRVISAPAPGYAYPNVPDYPKMVSQMATMQLHQIHDGMANGAHMVQQSLPQQAVFQTHARPEDPSVAVPIAPPSGLRIDVVPNPPIQYVQPMSATGMVNLQSPAPGIPTHVPLNPMWRPYTGSPAEYGPLSSVGTISPAFTPPQSPPITTTDGRHMYTFAHASSPHGLTYIVHGGGDPGTPTLVTPYLLVPAPMTFPRSQPPSSAGLRPMNGFAAAAAAARGPVAVTMGIMSPTGPTGLPVASTAAVQESVVPSAQ